MKEEFVQLKQTQNLQQVENKQVKKEVKGFKKLNKEKLIQKNYQAQQKEAVEESEIEKSQLQCQIESMYQPKYNKQQIYIDVNFYLTKESNKRLEKSQQQRIKQKNKKKYKKKKISQSPVKQNPQQSQSGFFQPFKTLQHLPSETQSKFGPLLYSNQELLYFDLNKNSLRRFKPKIAYKLKNYWLGIQQSYPFVFKKFQIENEQIIEILDCAEKTIKHQIYKNELIICIF